jgi:hypothetical protein
MSPPRNVKTPSPRSVAAALPERSLADTSALLTPTPPPVAVSAAPPPPAEPPPREKRRAGWWATLSMALVCALAAALGYRSLSRTARIEGAPSLGGAVALLEGLSSRDGVAEPGPPSASRPPSALRRDGYDPVSGGVLFVPKSFRPTSGDYDLVVHFHGDVDIVRESVEHAGVDAALAVVNWGVLTTPYRKIYDIPGRFEALVAQIERALGRRGLVGPPRLRRLALTSWSAGYAAVESILQHRASPPPDADPLDAIVLLDGVHCRFRDGDPRLIDPRSVMAFLRAAQAAAEGRILFFLTHSQIETVDYASTARTARFILESVGAEPARSPMLPLPPHLELEAARGAMPREAWLIPVSHTEVGLLRVLGFRGNTPEQHAAHLTQMAAVALPELARRWAAPSAPLAH